MSYQPLVADLASLIGPQLRERLMQAKAAIAEVLARADLPEPRRAELEGSYFHINGTLHDAARNALFAMANALTLSQELVDQTPHVLDVPPGMTVDESVALLDQISVETGPPPRAPLPVPPIRGVPAPPPPAPERDMRPVPVAHASMATNLDDRIPF